MGGVALRPVGGEAEPLRAPIGEAGQALGGDGRMPGFGQDPGHVQAQGTVEPFAVIARSGPALGGEACLGALLATGVLGLRQHPDDDRQVLRRRRRFRPGQGEGLGRRPVEVPEIGLDAGEQGIVTSGDADQRFIPGLLPCCEMQGVLRRILPEVANQPCGPGQFVVRFCHRSLLGSGCASVHCARRVRAGQGGPPRKMTVLRAVRGTGLRRSDRPAPGPACGSRRRWGGWCRS